MNQRTCSLWVACVVVGFSAPLASEGQLDGAEPKVGDGGRTENVPSEEQEVIDDGPVDRHSLQAEITKSDYDKECGLLAVQVQLKNVSEKPIFVVAEDFAFVRTLSGTRGYHLGVEQTSRALTLDLSHLEPTPDGAGQFREGGVVGVVPTVMEMRPQSFRYTTYVFHLGATSAPRVLAA